MYVSLFTANLIFILAIATSWLLLRHQPRLLLLIILVTSILETSRFLIKSNWSFVAWSSLLKLVCVWPLGFGSVILFGQLPKHLQVKFLPRFTIYINAAVLGNVAMMVSVPSDGTLRGLTHRPVCILMVLWLVAECHKVSWKTVKYTREDGMFTFIASPIPWVISHACYRTVMLTLPMFNTATYLMLDPFSLICMVTLSWFFASTAVAPKTTSLKSPQAFSWNSWRSYGSVSHWFGLADTMVVSTIAYVSTFIEIAPTPAQENMLDIVGVTVHTMIALVVVSALTKFMMTWRKDKGRNVAVVDDNHGNETPRMENQGLLSNT
jgi:hypothetical protein